MPLIENPETVDQSIAEIRRETRKGLTVQDAAQKFVQAFYSQFPDSTVLARIYATVPFGSLPERDRLFITSNTQESQLQPAINDDTRILSLLGSTGKESAWCDRYQSKSHLGIPLLSEEVVAQLPMIAGLIDQIGSSARWYSKLSTASEKSDSFGLFTESFFVADAASSRDNMGRLLIPAQDFVAKYGVRSVLGVGGEFPNTGMILLCIIFSSEFLHETPGWLARLPLALGTITQQLVTAGDIYSVVLAERPFD